ncbi:MAG TPA: 2,3-epoxybenzoyl-CoA dihydrolase [Vicinamibacterales bacterium]|nr:2,3-epoxybenzoyl-CoA dihydrolase [Vicinamibacterales bacterium]
MQTSTAAPLSFETHPSQYRHWKLSFDGPVATLGMDVREDGGLRDDYRLKLNSYDLRVDIELADAIQRIRFEHPEVRAVVLTSLKDRVFCAGANIYMLAGSSHAFKVNFCKFTNETRLAIEDASQHSGLKFLAAVNGACAGGGYELALACDEILLVDDGTSAVSLPEVPLLGVLPGTGGLTRLVEKRKVRRDLADAFCTMAEGVKGQRAVDWGLVDAVCPKSRFDQEVARRARDLAARSDRPGDGSAGITLGPLDRRAAGDVVTYSSVTLAIDRGRRTAELTVSAPDSPQPQTPDDFLAAGDRCWALRAFRELDDALLHLRVHEPEIGTILVRTAGDPEAVLAVDRSLATHRGHWLVREIVHFIKRTLKRLDLTARSVFALVEPGSACAGTLFELALAADRSYMLDDPERPNTIRLSAMNGGAYPMSNGLSRLDTRFLGAPGRAAQLLAHDGPFDAARALEAGLVSFAPDDLDWEDEVRLAIEERASLSPDALTGLEANVRLPGPETLETRIFGRLSAWQNWIFQRPNAAGERGALRSYGRDGRPEFEWERT